MRAYQKNLNTRIAYTSPKTIFKKKKKKKQQQQKMKEKKGKREILEYIFKASYVSPYTTAHLEKQKIFFKNYKSHTPYYHVMKL